MKFQMKLSVDKDTHVLTHVALNLQKIQYNRGVGEGVHTQTWRHSETKHVDSTGYLISSE